MTKKWKCISMRPPLRCVKIAEQDMSPNVAKTSRERLVNPDREGTAARDERGQSVDGVPEGGVEVDRRRRCSGVDEVRTLHLKNVGSTSARAEVGFPTDLAQGLRSWPRVVGRVGDGATGNGCFRRRLFAIPDFLSHHGRHGERRW